MKILNKREIEKRNKKIKLNKQENESAAPNVFQYRSLHHQHMTDSRKPIWGEDKRTKTTNKLFCG